MMIDIKTLKIGDKVRAVDVSSTHLTLNEKYTISEIIYDDEIHDKRVRLSETHHHKYYFFRFDIDINELRRQKLLKISNDD